MTVDADTAKKYYKRLGIKFFPTRYQPLTMVVYITNKNEETVTITVTVSFLSYNIFFCRIVLYTSFITSM